MPRLSQVKQRGDTLVEVLICLAIIGSALTISYGTARRSLYKIRDAHERGEMLTVAQTELERLKNKLLNDTSFYTKVDGFNDVTGNPDDLEKAFCITNNNVYTHVGNPKDLRCAVSRQGEFYMDTSPSTCNGPHADDNPVDNNCQAQVDDLGFSYRVGIAHRPKYPSDGQIVNEWYVIAGRSAAGGYGNTLDYSVVPIMYRQHPL